MTPPGAMPRRKWAKRVFLIALAVSVLTFGATAWYLSTESFQSMVRQRVISDIQRITGGMVELGSIHTRPFRLQFEIRDVTIRGQEGANETPYVHIDKVNATVKLLTAVGVKLGFRSLALDHPVIHIVFYPDGSTNQPRPTLRRASSGVERLFSLSVNDLEVRHGELLWNDERVPLDFEAHDVSAGLTYSHLHGRFDGELLARKIDTTFQDYRPLTWMAEAHFSLRKETLDVRSLRLSSGRSHLEATGHIAKFSNPQVDGNYIVALDLAEFAAITRHAELKQGLLQADGRGSWSKKGFSSKGTAALREFDWRDPYLTLKNAAARTQFTIDDKRIALTQMQGILLGGSVSGDGEIKLIPAGNTSTSTDGDVRLRVNGLSVADAANALSSVARPFSHLGVVGAATGKIQVTWQQSPRTADVRFDVAVAGPSHFAEGQLPVDGHCSGTYRAALDQLQVSDLSAHTRATQVTGSGTISSRARLQFSMTTADLSEVQRILGAAGYDELSTGALQGDASLKGTASGKISAITFAGELRSQNGRLHMPSDASQKSRELAWDSLTTYIQLSPEGASAQNGILHWEQSTVSFEGRVSLQGRKFTNTSSFATRVSVRHGETASLLAWVGYDLPVNGTVDISLQASGTRREPKGQAEIQLSHGAIYGHPLDELKSSLSFDGSQISVDRVQAIEGSEELSGAGSFNLSTHAYLLKFKGTNFHLAEFSELRDPRLGIDGRMDFTAQGQGTLAAPAINGSLRLTQLSFQHQRVGNFDLDASTQGAELHVTGHSDFKNADLELVGDVHLREDWPALIGLHFNHLDIDPLLKVYLHKGVTGPSAVAGDVRVQGPLKRMSELQITSSFSDMYLDLEHVQFRNNGPLKFVMSHNIVSIQQFRLIGQDTDVAISGSLQLQGDHALNLQAKGNAGLRLLQSLNPEFTSSGTLAMDVAIYGTVSKPRLQGRLELTRGALAYADLPGSLTEMNGSLVFTEDRLKIESLNARLGGGTVSLEGYSNFYNRQLNFNLGLQAQEVRLRYPQGISSIVNANVRLAGTPAASTLGGDVVINKLSVTPGFDFGAYLQRSSQSLVLPETDPLLNRIHLDAHITTAPQLQMQTAVLRLSGDADMRLRGTAAKPVLLGRADVMEGQIYVNGAKYRMERGDISFNNPVTTTAVLDLQATTRVRDYDITVNLNGSLDKLNLSYHSEPPLSTADIINLLALGQTQLQSAQLQQTAQVPFTQEASSAILAEALNTAVSNRSQRLFGMSHIKIDPQGLNTETAPTQTTPAVTIEQQVRDNLTLTYTTNVSQTSQQIIQGEYNITRDLSILGIRDYNGVVSFEIRLRRRRR